MTIVPEGGVVDTGNGQQSIVYGVIVNHYDPFESQARHAGQRPLDQATRDLVDQVRQTQHAPAGARTPRRETIDGAPARSVVLSGGRR